MLIPVQRVLLTVYRLRSEKAAKVQQRSCRAIIIFKSCWRNRLVHEQRDTLPSVRTPVEISVNLILSLLKFYVTFSADNWERRVRGFASLHRVITSVYTGKHKHAELGWTVMPWVEYEPGIRSITDITHRRPLDNYYRCYFYYLLLILSLLLYVLFITHSMSLATLTQCRKCPLHSRGSDSYGVVRASLLSLAPVLFAPLLWYISFAYLTIEAHITKIFYLNFILGWNGNVNSKLPAERV